MTTSTEIVNAIASSTGQILNDTFPIVTYFIGIFLMMFFLTIVWKFVIRPIGKIFK